MQPGLRIRLDFLTEPAVSGSFFNIHLLTPSFLSEWKFFFRHFRNIKKLCIHIYLSGISSGSLIPFAFRKFMLFHNNVHVINFNPVFVCVTARMQMSGNSDLSSLMKVFFRKLSVLSKGNAAEKICVLLSILMPVSSCNSKCIACCYGRFLFTISILLKCNVSLAPLLVFQSPILCSFFYPLFLKFVFKKFF